MFCETSSLRSCSLPSRTFLRNCFAVYALILTFSFFKNSTYISFRFDSHKNSSWLTESTLTTEIYWIPGVLAQWYYLVFRHFNDCMVPYFYDGIGAQC